MTTNKHDFRVGDVVSITGTVLQANDDVLDIEGTNKVECVWASNAVLVERPQPKVSVELTFDQLDDLCIEAVTGPLRHLYDTFIAAREEALSALD